jgi:ABC-type transporter Mla MlaB component
MTVGTEDATASLDTLDPGTHLCAFHRSPGQLTRIASTFIGHGLAAGDQLLYVTTDEQAEAVLRALPERAHADDAMRAGQLLLRTFAEAYGTRRPDDLGTVADGFRAAAAQSRKDGFRRLRVAAQMDDLAPLLGSPEQVISWERMSSALQREIGVSSVCLYDHGLVDADHADLIAREHDGLAPEVAEEPLARFLAIHEPWGLRVSGEVDVFNRDELLQVLQARAAVTHQLHVDIEDLRFADVGSLARVHSVAAGLPDHGWLILGRVPDAIRRTLTLSGLHHERLRLEP